MKLVLLLALLGHVSGQAISSSGALSKETNATAGTIAEAIAADDTAKATAAIAEAISATNAAADPAKSAAAFAEAIVAVTATNDKAAISTAITTGNLGAVIATIGFDFDPCTHYKYSCSPYKWNMWFKSSGGGCKKIWRVCHAEGGFSSKGECENNCL